MSWLSEMFGGGGNPANAANKYLDQIPGVSHEGYDPYINRGQEAGGIMSDQFGKMSQDPTAFINELMKGYQESDGYKYQQDQMGRAAGNTAAAGGMRGSAQDTQNQQQITQGLLGQDMQQYLSNLLGAQKTGLEGEQSIYNTGFNASQGLTGDLTNILGQQGGLAYQGAQNKNKQQQDWLKALMSGIGTAGGWEVGGPVGGTVGGNLANKFM